MKVCRLQRLTGQQLWEDHGYAFEREDGHCLFRFNNLIWGRLEAAYNAQMKKAGTKLEEVHQVIPATQRLRWLEIEIIADDPQAIKSELDAACQIPRTQPKPATA